MTSDTQGKEYSVKTVRLEDEDGRVLFTVPDG